jgi:hypothetical protein
LKLEERVFAISWVMDELATVRRNRLRFGYSKIGTAIGELDLLTELHRLLYLDVKVGETLLSLSEPNDGA